MLARILLVVLTALLALPAAHIASPVEARKRSRIVTREFRNPAPMNLPNAASAPVSASRYPAPVEVRGLIGPIRDVNVTLHDVFHTNGVDMEVLLVGPDGQTAILMADAGEETDPEGVTLTFDDEAAQQLPDNKLHTGRYRPNNQNNVAVSFNPPAPLVTSANAALSVFDGGDPNGTWRLFVQDRFVTTDPGIIASGWSLEIEAKATTRKKNKR